MDIGLHKSSEGIIYKAMGLYPLQADKVVRHDPDSKVPEAASGTLMTRVKMALIDDVQNFRVECTSQPRTNFIDSLNIHEC